MATNKPTITDIQDTFTTLVTNQNTISLALGATGRLTTNQDSDAISAINELEVAIRGTSNNLVSDDLSTGGLTATDLTAAIVELDSDIGANPHDNLTTTAKTLTGGVNELDALQGNVALTTTATTITGAIVELDSDIGARPHTSLTTTASNLTAAINEHDAELGTITAGAMGTTASTVSGAISELEVEIDTLNTFVEPTQSLTTTATTLADAINEHDAEIGAASLNTSATTLRGAINELHTEVGDAISGDNLTTGNIGSSLNLLDSAVGNLDNLNTDGSIANRTNLVTSINSLADDILLLDSDTTLQNSRLGSLNDLDAAFVGSERDNFVAALNALRADIPLI